ncbi:MAG: SCP2 sterol-binding domain-containing protein [Porticoccaceae bacterium]|nr:SCP2 sterol-binding domain-containing protein [Porticoccaceae bacterium]
MTIQTIIDGLKEKIGEDCGLGSVVKFDFGDQGSVILDATQVPNTVSTEGADPDCTMIISIENFMAMAEGSLDGVAAFMTGRLKIEGEMGIAMKLSAILT